MLPISAPLNLHFTTHYYNLSRGTAFPTRLHVRPAKTLIRLRGSVFSQGIQCVASNLTRAQLQSCRKCCAPADVTAVFILNPLIG